MKSETFWEKIKKRRRELKLSRSDLAKRIAYASTSSLARIENNQWKNIPEEKIKFLAEALQLNYPDLIVKYLSEKIYKEIKNRERAKEAIALVSKRLEEEGRGTIQLLDRDSILSRIREYLSNKPIEKAWLFGSFAREEESADSDIDLLIRFVENKRITLFDLIDIQQDLEEKTGRQVDLVQEGTELTHIKPYIDKDKILIYAS
ncbi:MAG: nucleotidyltransferase domain-containing protein [Bacteroidota bacterium]